MEKRIKDSLQYLEQLDFNALSKEEQNALSNTLLQQISFFQHERLIHLIVTAIFAIVTFLCLLSNIFQPSLSVILLTFVLLILLVPYIRHYYILENSVQKMYTYYDKLFPWN